MRHRKLVRWIAITLLCTLSLDLLFSALAYGQENPKGESDQSSGLIAPPRALRVLSYNIHHGRGMDDQVDLSRIAKVISESKADLIALQEVDDRTRRTGGVDQTAELARLTGMHARFAKAIDFEGGEYGQALLSRWPIGELKIEWLPGEPDREQRIVAFAVVDYPGFKITFGTTHLHHANSEFRLRQAKQLNAIAEKLTGEVILAGDFNAEPSSAPMEVLLGPWTVSTSESESLKTFPSRLPTKQIDYVMFRRSSALEIVTSQVIEEPLASDHRPLLVVLELQLNASR